MKADAIEMQKGERRVVAVELIRTDLDSRLVMRFKPTDGSNLTIPASARWPRLAKNIQFEIVAGNTTGDFVVQLSAQHPDGTPSRDEAAARQEAVSRSR